MEMEINGKKRYFRLSKDEDGEISLIATNKNGAILEDGYVLAIRSDGAIETIPGLTGRAGLQRDERKRAVVEQW